MQTFLQITSENGQFYYTLFYKLSFLLAFLLFVYIGIRKKYPMHTWLLIGAAVILFFIIGTKVGTYSWQEWKMVLTNGQFPETQSKSLVGGLVFGIVFIVLIKKGLKFKPSVLDAYAIILPFALIVQRIGCLLAGCCFGNISSLPWSIEYSAHYAVAQHQIQEGIISDLATTSMAVHPVPLYLIGVYLIVLLAHWKTAHRWKHNGSIAFFGISVLFGLRFFVEFFRDPGTNHAMGAMVFGLKEIQWLLLFMVLLSTLILVLRERFGVLTFSNQEVPSKGIGHHILLTFILLIIIALGSNWFTIPEALILHTYLILVLLAISFKVWKSRKQLQLKFGALALIPLAFFLMSQTYNQDPDKTQDDIGDKTRTLTIGARQGDLDIDYVENEYSGDGCDRQLINSDTINLSSGFSTNIQYLEKKRKSSQKESVIGAGITYSQFKKSVQFAEASKETSFGANLFFGADFEFIGYRYGLSLGELKQITNYDQRDDVNSRIRSASIFPIVALRIGKEDFFFAEGQYGADLPYDILFSRYKFGLGFGTGLFNAPEKGLLKVGLAENIDEMVFYLDADIAVGDFLILQPGARFGKYPVYGLGLSFRL